MKTHALIYLYRQLKATKLSIAHAEVRPHVPQEELDNLAQRVKVLDYIIDIVSKEDEE